MGRTCGMVRGGGTDVSPIQLVSCHETKHIDSLLIGGEALKPLQREIPIAPACPSSPGVAGRRQMNCFLLSAYWLTEINS